LHGVRKARAFLLAATKRDASPNTETVQATTNGVFYTKDID